MSKRTVKVGLTEVTVDQAGQMLSASAGEDRDPNELPAARKKPVPVPELRPTAEAKTVGLDKFRACWEALDKVPRQLGRAARPHRMG